MFNRLCIRSKILFSIIIVLTMSTGSVLLLLNRLERNICNASTASSNAFSYDYFSGMVLTGDIHTSFLLNKDYPLIEKNNNNDMQMLTTIHRMRNHVMIVFAFSALLGLVLSILVARSIKKPIMQIIQKSKSITNGKMEKGPLKPGCTELQILADSFKMMQNGIRENDEEKSRLESVEITKNLAAGIAHEIKNPINTVGLITDYLQTNLSPDNPEKRYEFYKLSDNMKNELKRINRIVEGFLRLTKPDVYNFLKENINSIIQYNVSVLEPEVVKQRITMELNLDPMLPDIKADKDRLNQVFSNLILNAIEAMPRGGNITIATNARDEHVEIKISDSGIGIPAEDLNKIYNPYYTTKKRGFGLGLSLIHSIIYKHNGKISVKSEKGKGTEFVIIMPVDFPDE